jgi:chromosome partitioning protein
MDPQGHSTLGLLTGSVAPSKTMYDVFVHHSNGREIRIRDIIRTAHVNLDVAPADILLSAVPDAIAAEPNREGILAEILDDVRDDYDYLLVDCPPHVGLLTFNALCACSEAIVPVDPSFFSLHGIGKQMETFDVLARKTGREVAARALLTLYSGRAQFARDVANEIRKHLGGRYFTTVIRHSMKLAEAASHGVPIARYARRCAGYDDYLALSIEVLEMESGRHPNDAADLDTPDADDLAAPSAPRTTQDGVVFTLDAPNAQRVQLVGDFNGWTLEGNDMARVGSMWTSVLRIPPGRYRYRYVIDGHWYNDPMNADVEPSPYGGDNSVLVVNEGVLEQAWQ